MGCYSVINVIKFFTDISCKPRFSINIVVPDVRRERKHLDEQEYDFAGLYLIPIHAKYKRRKTTTCIIKPEPFCINNLICKCLVIRISLSSFDYHNTIKDLVEINILVQLPSKVNPYVGHDHILLNIEEAISHQFNSTLLQFISFNC